MLVFLLFLVFVGGLVHGGARALEMKNSKGETFSYKDRLQQETEVYDIKDRFDQKLCSSADHHQQVNDSQALAFRASAPLQRQGGGKGVPRQLHRSEDSRRVDLPSFHHRLPQGEQRQ